MSFSLDQDFVKPNIHDLLSFYCINTIRTVGLSAVLRMHYVCQCVQKYTVAMGEGQTRTVLFASDGTLVKTEKFKF